MNSKKHVIKGLEWIGERVSYPERAVHGDTFPMTWAEDGEIYTSSGDPIWGACINDDGMDVEKFIGYPPDYFIARINIMPQFKGYAGTGPKPTGMICVKGKLYLSFQNYEGNKSPAHGNKSQHGSDACIIMSADHGTSWSPSFKDIQTPMFPGHLFGGPVFINYGKNNEYAPDEYIYAVSSDQWDNGCQLRLGRVPADRILNALAWQWVQSLDDDRQPRWTYNLAKSSPVLCCKRSLSMPDMVYLKCVDRYVLATCRFHTDFSPKDGTNLLIYEAEHPWGPFDLVFQEKSWAGANVNPYCPRLPLKWFDSDNLTGWLQFSGSWDSAHDIEGYRPYYRSHIQQFRLLVE